MRKIPTSHWFFGIITVVILIWFINTKIVDNPEIRIIEIPTIKKNPITIIEEEIKTSLVQNQKQEGSLISKCESDFKYYADISKKKYNVRISILETEEVFDRDSIDNFSEIWGYSFDVGTTKSSLYPYNLPELDFPIVLLAIKFEGTPKGQLPIVIACDNNGKIMERSRGQLLTFGQFLSFDLN